MTRKLKKNVFFLFCRPELMRNVGEGKPIRERKQKFSINFTNFQICLPNHPRTALPTVVLRRKEASSSISTLCDAKKLRIRKGKRGRFWQNRTRILISPFHPHRVTSCFDRTSRHPADRKMETWEGADGESDICHHSRRCNSLCLPFSSDFHIIH